MPSLSQDRGTNQAEEKSLRNLYLLPFHPTFPSSLGRAMAETPLCEKSEDASTATLHQRMSGREREGGGGGRGRDKFCDSFPHRVIQNKMLCNYASLMETPSLSTPPPPKERLSHAWVPVSPRSPAPGAACVCVSVCLCHTLISV